MSDVPAAYRASKGSVLDVDKEFYNTLTEANAERKLVATHIVPLRDGLAWKVPAGHVFRVKVTDGPQVGDFNMWNLHKNVKSSVQPGSWATASGLDAAVSPLIREITVIIATTNKADAIINP